MDGALDDIGPGTVDGWPAYAAGVLWAMREQGLEVTGLDLVIDSTVPLGAGLSSSAALECAVAVAVAGLTGLELTASVRRDLVAACMRAESEVAGAPTGGMDQTIAMLATEGSALLVDFDRDLADAGGGACGAAAPRRGGPAGHRHPGLARAGRRRVRRPPRPSATARPLLSACRRSAPPSATRWRRWPTPCCAAGPGTW